VQLDLPRHCLFGDEITVGEDIFSPFLIQLFQKSLLFGKIDHPFANLTPSEYGRGGMILRQLQPNPTLVFHYQGLSVHQAGSSPPSGQRRLDLSRQISPGPAEKNILF